MTAIAHALGDAERAAARGDAEIAPARCDIFRALNCVPVDKVRAVIVGQDPYPIFGDADGLAFSVRRDFNLPGALTKILAEARRDLNWTMRTSGDLTRWAESGVLLLNAVLTNLVGFTWAHGGLGWQRFSRAVLDVVARREQQAVILLWGGEAATLKAIFEGTEHKVLLSDHPCASREIIEGSTKRPFKGSKPFSAANAFLRRGDVPEIDWTLPPAGPHPLQARAATSSEPRRPARRRRAT